MAITQSELGIDFETALKRQRTERLLQRIESDFSYSHNIYGQAFSPNFASTRKNEVRTLFMSGGVGKNDMPKAFFSEWLTKLGFAELLKNTDYSIDMAPPNIESGCDSRNGIDAIVSKDRAPIAGINVKLKHLFPRSRTEKQRFDSFICAPAIELSIGDWEIVTREQQRMRIRDWMQHLALPNISGSGKIPYFLDFRKYLLNRVQHTLDSYLWKVDGVINGIYVPSEQEIQQHFLPDNQTDFLSFYNKLVLSQQLFSRFVKKT